jgi:septal ring factor EnvC (AmiA/AmiB activator)
MQVKERTEERRNMNKPSPYKPEKQLGEGVGGKFLNRFKDFEPDINRLENKISNIENILSRLEEDLKKKETEVKEEETENLYNPTQPEPEQEVPEGYVPLQQQPNSLPFSAADLSQGASNLRSFIPYVKPENEEQNDILNILKKRRQDIEPDEYEEDEEEDWGAGSKKIKLLKFINKHKLKKRFKIKDSSSSSSDDSSSDEEEED